MQAARGASLNDADDQAHGDHHDAGAPARSVRRRPAVLLFVGVAGLLLAVDQVTKAWAVAELRPGHSRELVGELLQLTLVRNPGAAFGTGEGVTPVFTTLALCAAVVTAWFALRRTASLPWALTLGLLFAGVVGNLVDRLVRPPGFYHGHVIDFFQLPNWPVFNVADICINLAAALFLVLAWRAVPLVPVRAGESATTEVPEEREGDDR